MSYYDRVYFPGYITEGTSGGGGFKTSVKRGDSNATQRSTEWARNISRKTFEVGQQELTRSDLGELIRFLRVAHGSAHGFNYFDPTDNSSDLTQVGSLQTTLPVFHYAQIGVTDGVTKWFEFEKPYRTVFAANTSQRQVRQTRLIKPGENQYGVAVALTGIAYPMWGNNVYSPAFQALAVQLAIDVTIDYDAGWLRLTLLNGQPFPAGIGLEVACRHYTPMRLGQAADDGVTLSWNDSDEFTVSDLDMVSLAVDPVEGPEEHLRGGFYEASVGQPYTIDLNNGQYQKLQSGGGGGLAVRTPDVSGLYQRPQDMEGGPVCMIENAHGTQTLVIFDQTGARVASLNAGQVAVLYYHGSGRWLAR